MSYSKLMKTIYTFLLSVWFCGHLSAEEVNLSKMRLDQLKIMKTKSLLKWPKDPGLLYQGLHYKLDEAVKTKEEFEKVVALIPKQLKEGYYKPKEVKDIDGWFVIDAGISIIALKKGLDILMFGYQW